VESVAHPDAGSLSLRPAMLPFAPERSVPAALWRTDSGLGVWHEECLRALVESPRSRVGI